MAEKNRNVNLEEIDADTLFGIDALRHQTLFQKILFFGMILGGIVENVLLSYFTKLPSVVCILIFLAMLLIGIAFGCNYTEDMTYGKYLFYFFFRPSKELEYRSTEDIREIRKAGEAIRKADEKRLMEERKADPAEQQKLLLKLLLFGALILMVVIAALIYASIRNESMIHHVVPEAERVMAERIKGWI